MREDILLESIVIENLTRLTLWLNMIVSKLRGGLGNQLFGYAAGRALAARLNTELFLDLDDYDIKPNREFELQHYKLEFKRYLRPRNRWRQWFKRPLMEVTEPHYHWGPILEETPDNSRIQGYWHSEKYFRHLRDNLLNEFELRSPLEGPNEDAAREIQAAPSVSLHIRRTDYLMPHILKFHGVMPIEYFQNALRIVREKAGKVRIWIFSDDMEWARVHFSGEPDVRFVDWNLNRPTEDLRLMSLCSHNIIVNSTFGWWGAWLNRNPKRIVVAPRNWFLDRTHDTRDVIPEDWIKI